MLTAHNKEVISFIIVGGSAVLLVNGVYLFLVQSNIPIYISSSVAYLAGSAFAFFANRTFTFKSTSPINRSQITRYGLVYMTTLLVNTVTNMFALFLIKGIPGDLLIAYTFATGVSCILNFLGLKLLVFGGNQS